MSFTSSNQPIVSVRSLSRSFGKFSALSSVNIDIYSGGVIGLVGENGAGKTTLIRHLLGLLKPDTGHVSVFGLDPVDDPHRVLEHVGYVSEDRDLPDWMRIRELIRFQRAFYRDWDDSLTNELLGRFELDPEAKVKALSRGQRARVCLLIALAHRPKLLILDEPSSGLDSVVRKDVLAAVIRTVADEGRTVLFSSHLLDEVQRVADHLIMINRGQIQFDAPIDDVVESHHRLIVKFPNQETTPNRMPGVLSCSEHGQEWQVISNGQHDRFVAKLNEIGGEIVDQQTPTLEEIFVARCGSRSQDSIINEKVK